MNRHDRRAAAKTRGFSDPDDCPCCNLRRVFMHAVGHADDIQAADGAKIVYPTDEDGRHAVADFGILSIEHCLESHEFTIRQFGEVAMTLTSEGFTIEKPGPWIEALTGIRMMLDQRFGPIFLGPDEGHTMH